METTKEQLQQKIMELERELESFKRVNIELCKAINSGKHRKLLSALLAQYSQ